MGISKKVNDTSSVNKAIKGWWIVTGIIIFMMFFCVFAISQGWLGKLPPVSDLQNPINKYASRVYSADDKLIGTWSYASENRVMVPYDSLPENLVKAFERLSTTEGAESICTVEQYSYPPQRATIIVDGELKQLHPENYYARSQDLQPIYHDCNQFFLFKTYALMRDQKLYTEHTLPFILAESESQDIDTMEDWKLMEMKDDLLHQKD